jgi:peptidoglycan hydrolase-like protein with peptidoglycan-binding domain
MTSVLRLCYASGMADLQRGSKGQAVAELQSALNRWGNFAVPLDVDGDFGPKTEGAVKVFQEMNSLSVTGRADPITVAALLKKISPKSKVGWIVGGVAAVAAAIAIFI